MYLRDPPIQQIVKLPKNNIENLE